MDKLKPNLQNFNLKKQEGKIISIFIISLLIYIIFILFSDFSKISDITLKFNWGLIPLLLFLTALNYIFRALRFYIYLKEIHIAVPFKRALSIFLSGLSMTVTPGKTGEIVKAYLLKKDKKITLSEVLPLLIIERMTDGIAMILLGASGIFFLQNTTLFFIAFSLFVIAFIVFLKAKNFVLPYILKLEKIFPKFKLLKFFEVFFEKSQTLVSFKNLSIGIIIGCIAWFFEGYSLYLLINEFVPIDFLSGLSKSLFIFSFSSIIGFFVLIPGGIGVAEGSISYLSTLFFQLGTAESVFVTLLFRFITLWFGVCLGLAALIYNLRNRDINES